MTDRLKSFESALSAADRPEIWIDIVDNATLRTEFDRASGPLAGMLLAVKNNVDVAGLPTTAACPGFADAPAATDADAVARLRRAGATVVGTTNMDQFATGLVGQRSPYGGVRDARRPAYVSGGSSSGSAVAVALGIADIAIGTDTAGSGRVPAALQGIVGIKPTLGLVSTRGLVPACKSWDAVTIMARDLETANVAMGAMAGGASTRPVPVRVPLKATPDPVVAIPAKLPGVTPDWVLAFERSADRLRANGVTIRPVPFDDFVHAARLLYEGGLVAERHASVGSYVDANRAQVDRVVGDIISDAGTISATRYLADRAHLDDLRTRCSALLDGCDGLMVPTAPGHPSIAEVAADPVGVNAWLGTYTNFANLFDMCGVAVPAGTAGSAQFGVTILAPAFHDAVALDIARLANQPATSVAHAGANGPLEPAAPWIETAIAPTTDLFVVGAHLPGQPLEGQLTARGARYVGPSRTAAGYRLFALNTEPAKPGLVRDRGRGSEIDGGIWRLSPSALAAFLSDLPEPMSLGPVELVDGMHVVGFGCDASALDEAMEITEFGGWLHYLECNEPQGDRNLTQSSDAT